MTIRAATTDDLPVLLDLIEIRRQHLQAADDKIWNLAANREEMTTAFFTFLIEADDVITLVNEAEGGDIDGLIFVNKTTVPPVYDVGGEVYMIDDFVPGSDGPGLIAASEAEAKKRGAVGIIMISPAPELDRQELGAAAGYKHMNRWLHKTL